MLDDVFDVGIKPIHRFNPPKLDRHAIVYAQREKVFKNRILNVLVLLYLAVDFYFHRDGSKVTISTNALVNGVKSQLLYSLPLQGQAKSLAIFP